MNDDPSRMDARVTVAGDTVVLDAGGARVELSGASARDLAVELFRRGSQVTGGFKADPHDRRQQHLAVLDALARSTLPRHPDLAELLASELSRWKGAWLGVHTEVVAGHPARLPSEIQEADEVVIAIRALRAELDGGLGPSSQ